jgi:hypothetical protein
MVHSAMTFLPGPEPENEQAVVCGRPSKGDLTLLCACLDFRLWHETDLGPPNLHVGD